MAPRIQDLRDGNSFDSFFIVASSREGTTKRGSRFLTLDVTDTTGKVTGRIWTPDTACPDGLKTPGVYRLVGRVESYREELQLNIEGATVHQPRPDEYDQLVKTSRWDGELLVREISEHIHAHVRSERLKRLLFHVLEHPDVRERFPVTPAAAANHHAYRSGLAEHTLSMMRLATMIATHYASYYPGFVNGDLLIAGVLLHDLGKVWELGGELATTYTTVGRLVGHIPMGSAFIADMAREVGDIPQSLVWELQHLILSHHGQLEYGSPQLPKTVEAQILHYIDQIDAKTNTFFGVAGEPGWTGFQRNFGRPLFNPANERAEWGDSPTGGTHSRGPGTVTATFDATVASRRPNVSEPEPPTERLDDAVTGPIAAPKRARKPTRTTRKNAQSSAMPPAPAPMNGSSNPTSGEFGPGHPDGEQPPPPEEPPPSTLNLFDGLD